MNALILLLALVPLALMIRPAFRHDAELPISHTGKAKR